MQFPETIIELNVYFTEENRKKFLKFISENFDIEEKNIEIYQARNYSNESEFASEIYAQIFREMKDEY